MRPDTGATRFARRHLIFSLLCLLSVPLAAATYDLVYGTVAAGASKSVAGTGAAQVEIVSTSVTDGVGGKRAASATYTIEPVVGTPTGPTAAIADWSLY